MKNQGNKYIITYTSDYPCVSRPLSIYIKNGREWVTAIDGMDGFEEAPKFDTEEEAEQYRRQRGLHYYKVETVDSYKRKVIQFELSK